MGHVDSIAAVVVLQAVVVIVCKLLSNISQLSPCTLSSLRLKMSYKFLYSNTLNSVHFGTGNFPHYSKSALFEVTVM